MSLPETLRIEQPVKPATIQGEKGHTSTRRIFLTQEMYDFLFIHMRRSTFPALVRYFASAVLQLIYSPCLFACAVVR